MRPEYVGSRFLRKNWNYQQNKIQYNYVGSHNLNLHVRGTSDLVISPMVLLTTHAYVSQVTCSDNILQPNTSRICLLQTCYKHHLCQHGEFNQHKNRALLFLLVAFCSCSPNKLGASNSNHWETPFCLAYHAGSRVIKHFVFSTCPIEISSFIRFNLFSISTQIRFSPMK